MLQNYFVWSYWNEDRPILESQYTITILGLAIKELLFKFWKCNKTIYLYKLKPNMECVCQITSLHRINLF